LRERKLAVLRFDAGVFDGEAISVEIKGAKKAEFQVNFSVQCEFSTSGQGHDVGAEPSMMRLLMAASGIEADHVNQLAGATTLSAHMISSGSCSHRPRLIRLMKLPSAEGAELPRDRRPMQCGYRPNRHR
jgi:hypothetical protein